jgi:hypothetical protein
VSAMLNRFHMLNQTQKILFVIITLSLLITGLFQLQSLIGGSDDSGRKVANPASSAPVRDGGSSSSSTVDVTKMPVNAASKTEILNQLNAAVVVFSDSSIDAVDKWFKVDDVVDPQWAITGGRDFANVWNGKTVTPRQFDVLGEGFAVLRVDVDDAQWLLTWTTLLERGWRLSGAEKIGG